MRGVAHRAPLRLSGAGGGYGHPASPDRHPLALAPTDHLAFSEEVRGIEDKTTDLSTLESQYALDIDWLHSGT